MGAFQAPRQGWDELFQGREHCRPARLEEGGSLGAAPRSHHALAWLLALTALWKGAQAWQVGLVSMADIRGD